MRDHAMQEWQTEFATCVIEEDERTSYYAQLFIGNSFEHLPREII